MASQNAYCMPIKIGEFGGGSIRNTRRIFRRVSFYFVFSLALFSALQATAATLFCVSLAIFDAINKLCRAKYCCKALFMDFEEKKMPRKPFGL